MKKTELIELIRTTLAAYPNKSFSKIAAFLLNHNIEIELSHRTLRRLVSRVAKDDKYGKYESIRKLPAVLVFDIETSPMEVFVWGLYKQRINPDNVIADWNMISWAAKWLFDSEILSDTQTPEEAINRDDKRIVKSLWELFEKADVVIAHNAVRFDIKKANARFIEHNLQPPSPYQVVDTLVQSHKNFAFSSHKLDYLAQMMFNKEKLHTDYELWKRCVKGEKEALDYMQEYNIKDVAILEELYMEMRGWMTSHPNLRLYGDTDIRVCHVCLSENLEELASEYVTPAGRFQSFRCAECGAVSRVRKSNLTKKEKETMVVATAR